MAKVKNSILSILLLLLVKYIGFAQQQLYTVQYAIVDSIQQKQKPPLQTTTFSSRFTAAEYIAKLIPSLSAQGYITASIDTVQYDSLSARVHLYLGESYKWTKLNTALHDQDILEAIRWNTNALGTTTIGFSDLQLRQQEILNYLEETGHPFATIYLDSIVLQEETVQALLKIKRGPLYKIDSIRIYGDSKISNEFLQRYLNLPNGSIYSKKKLQNVSKKLAQLAYVEEVKASDLTLLGTGSVLNLYLKPVKNSQVNALVGFLPNPGVAAEKKLLVTGEANILLRNALGSGETIGINWQQLQLKSPRLHLLYEHPFVFRSAFGLSFQFDMFRKDSTFLNIDLRIGVNYGAGEVQTASLFLQRRSSIVNGINTAQVLFTKKLPEEADISSDNLGIVYQYNNTDYRLNPQRGTELSITSSAGIKKIKKNNQVLELKDPGNPSFKFESLYDTVKLKTYQFRVIVGAAQYFSVGKQGTFKAGLQAGLFSSGNIFRNEVFQIGGYRLLRGFDEESQYVSQYAVGTAEYRYLIGRNSNFFAFADGGWGRHLNKDNHTYISTGFGIAFETGAGIFNLVLALGKRDDTEFNLRQSKIHLGFVNYF